MYSTEALHKETGIDWLDVSRAKATVIETFKCLQGLNPPNVCSLIKPYVPARTTRLGMGNNICCPIMRTRLGEIDFPWRAHCYWSVLPNELRSISSLPNFKDNIKTFNGFVHIR